VIGGILLTLNLDTSCADRTGARRAADAEDVYYITGLPTDCSAAMSC
jgi:hypothetical protein